ncbi:hypothetical protein KXW29_005037 [Aspergillus fumigatus]|uniref:Serine-threonine/tyrosine-protein kinase catalytic domain-containing protein n=1 Tax=Aspergillus fumigatus TaxID=746128 RepID=A0A9P8NAU8_ASPFM|nr:hypothetical protein KXV57_001771 [Aspergillus fumigatus]KAH2270642.1 hypothetical protein KXW02_001469 [Aspergillus fumigatus]KAH2712995.1 hypothetical protein KXW29_005037 [Aspergillus fumigatus]
MESDRKARKVVTGRPKQLGLPQVVKAKRSAEPLVVVRAKESPFDTFQQLFSCELAGTVVFVQRRTRPYKTKAIRRHPPEIRNKILCIFQRIDHENVMCAEECYVNDGIVFAVVDNLPLTLQHLVQHCTLYPTEGQLGSIIAQILSGITYLATVDFEHRSLICKNILLGKDGTVKIGMARTRFHESVKLMKDHSRIGELYFPLDKPVAPAKHKGSRGFNDVSYEEVRRERWDIRGRQRRTLAVGFGRRRLSNLDLFK